MTLVTTYVLKKELPCLTQHSGTSSRTFKRIYEPEDWQFFNFICEFVSHTGISCLINCGIQISGPHLLGAPLVHTGIKSESEGTGEILLLQINIPNLYPKLLHPEHRTSRSQSNQF